MDRRASAVACDASWARWSGLTRRGKTKGLIPPGLAWNFVAEPAEPGVAPVGGFDAEGAGLREPGRDDDELSTIYFSTNQPRPKSFEKKPFFFDSAGAETDGAFGLAFTKPDVKRTAMASRAGSLITTK